MKLEEYNITKNTLTLKFDKKFRQIKLLKLEFMDGNTNIMDTDNLEMKFSKEKQELILFIKEKVVFVVLYISSIDNEDCNNAYYIKGMCSETETTCSETEMNMTGVSLGLSKLIKDKSGDFFSDNENINKIKNICSIKSENIFAEIIKSDISKSVDIIKSVSKHGVCK